MTELSQQGGPVLYWKGLPVEQMTREELISAVQTLALQNKGLRDQLAGLTPHIDFASYLSPNGKARAG